MKLLVDMNLSPKWVGYLVAVGYEAIHWSALGAGNAPDSEIMAHARTGNFVVLTSDLDFSRWGQSFANSRRSLCGPLPA
ncbi:hypothetical protein MASR1M60_29030 [Rhodocyclaceae bacterium]